MEDEIVEGQVLDGKYRVDRVLGRGGMGVVVLGRHLVLDEAVAIKCLAREVLASAEVVARFEREARAALKIKSEHVVRVLDFGRLPSGSPYMVMEYLQGEDLSRWLEQRGALPLELAVDFILQAGVALASAHAAGIVHRDIKPANLFCTLGNDGQPVIKVLDFGISKLTEASLKDSSLSVTKTASLMGSPLYMSPEQVQNSKDVDARTDIWSLGVVLFELIAQRTPFAGETFGEVAVKIAIQPAPRLAELRGDVPPAFDSVMEGCLAKDRNRRFASVGAFAAALAPFASRRGHATVERIAGIELSQSSPHSLTSAHSGPGVAIARSAGSFASAPSGGVATGGTAGSTGTGVPETGSAWSGTSPKRSSRWARVATLGVLVTALAPAGMVLLRRGPIASAPSSSAETVAVPSPEGTAGPTAAQVPAAPTPPPSIAVAPAPLAAESASASPEAPPAPSAAPEAAPKTGSGAARSRPARPAAGPLAKPEPATTSPAPRPTAAAGARPPAPKADCDPPYTLDEQGRKKFKPECFLK